MFWSNLSSSRCTHKGLRRRSPRQSKDSLHLTLLLISLQKMYWKMWYSRTDKLFLPIVGPLPNGTGTTRNTSSKMVFFALLGIHLQSIFPISPFMLVMAQGIFSSVALLKSSPRSLLSPHPRRYRCVSGFAPARFLVRELHKKKQV